MKTTRWRLFDGGNCVCLALRRSSHLYREHLCRRPARAVLAVEPGGVIIQRTTTKQKWHHMVPFLFDLWGEITDNADLRGYCPVHRPRIDNQIKDGICKWQRCACRSPGDHPSRSYRRPYLQRYCVPTVINWHPHLRYSD